MDISLEIRKLPYSNVKELAQILDLNDSWKKLMAIIPKLLDKENYTCDVSRLNPHKYHSEHFKLLENASITMQKMCTELLFSEWGTSARVRPCLGHLLYLLTKAELYRAADYVAVNLLKLQRPLRPRDGPAADIPTILPVNNMGDLERILDEMNYPSSVISNIMNSYGDGDVNVNINTSTREISIPKIVISEPESQRNSGINAPLVRETNLRGRLTRQDVGISHEETNVQGNSNVSGDSIGALPNLSAIMNSCSDNRSGDSSTFLSNQSDDSSTSLSNQSDLNESSDYSSSNYSSSVNAIPHLSDIMSTTSSRGSQSFLPNLSEFNVNSGQLTENVPTLSQLLEEQEKENVPSLSTLLESQSTIATTEADTVSTSLDSSGVLPNLSILEDELVPKMSILMNESQSDLNLDIPQLNHFLSNKSDGSRNFLPITLPSLSETSSYTSSKSLEASNASRCSRNTCASPLPNLNLNTPLPHFSYYDVETATENFNESPHKNCRQVENPFAKANGRFLGSGAFGSVFLGLGLTERPVAVKKLFLNNMDVVNVDDPVTKQFKNEVEVLSNYKHDNLLSLIGYSCDGPTYCLLYEFMPGGALKDRIQDIDEKLFWTDRLYIALGTARAVSYLHTANINTPLIHRDVKTANILLDCSNKPKLCDFGLIKLIPGPNTNTSTSAFGTSAYMAREAFRGDVSVKLDTYSFGVVLLELITGLPPLDDSREGCDIVTHVEDICDDLIAPLIDTKAGMWVAKNINFAEKLYQISIKCLEQNKKKRPTMVEVTEELTELIKLCA